MKSSAAVDDGVVVDKPSVDPIISVNIADSLIDRHAAFRIRHQVYCEERGEFGCGNSNRLFLDHYDCYPETTILLAKVDGVPCATMRMTGDNPIGLPLESQYDLSVAKANCLGKIFSVSMLASLAEYRKSRATREMIDAGFRLQRSRGFDSIICVVNADIANALSVIYRLSIAWDGYFCPKIGNTLACMYGNIHDARIRKFSGCDKVNDKPTDGVDNHVKQSHEPTRGR